MFKPNKGNYIYSLHMRKPTDSFYAAPSKILTLALRFSVLFTSSSSLSPRIATLSANHKIYILIMFQIFILKQMQLYGMEIHLYNNRI